jgi:hypothetical protein
VLTGSFSAWRVFAAECLVKEESVWLRMIFRGSLWCFSQEIDPQRPKQYITGPHGQGWWQDASGSQRPSYLQGG